MSVIFAYVKNGQTVLYKQLMVSDFNPFNLQF